MVHAPQTLNLDAFTYKWCGPVWSQLEQLKGVTVPNPLANRNDSKYQSSFLSSWDSIPSIRNEDGINYQFLFTMYQKKHLDFDHLTA